MAEEKDIVTPGVSIVISTRNRRDDVLTAVESSLAQQYEPLEVLLYDDASTDGTAAAVRDRFPEVSLHASDEQVGYLVWRNQGFRDATGEYVISIDDDSYFTDIETVSRLVELFDEYPRAAAIALPYLEPFSDRSNGRMSSQPVGTQLRHYVGCAHALRRDLVLELNGYPEFLIHQGEERDLCLRFLEQDWQVVYGDTPPLVHMYSPNRDSNRVSYYGYRNTLLFSGMHVPQPYLFPRMVIDSIQLLKHRFRWQALPAKLHGVVAGWVASIQYLAQRSAVSRSTYLRYRALPGHGPIENPGNQLPSPLRQDASAACLKH